MKKIYISPSIGAINSDGIIPLAAIGAAVAAAGSAVGSAVGAALATEAVLASLAAGAAAGALAAQSATTQSKRGSSLQTIPLKNLLPVLVDEI
ncbi:MAG: hypothetical protein LBS60_08075 [Deltaproteobacteria bacterium]|jgi:hypothetical protein|nr:hypothetical protein [Deltaproteobacteria bacterium]